MKRFTILSAALIVVSGVAAAFTTNKSTAPSNDVADLTGTCVVNGNGTVSCILDADLTASCLTSGIKNSANSDGTSGVVGDCTLN